MSAGDLLAVGVCTYRRPALLGACLDSVSAADRPSGVPCALVVVDNDAGGSAEPAVRDFERRSGLAVYYSIEPSPGIPFARNAALRRALALGATELAFIDDDETVDSRWLVRLWDHYRSSGADVVRGYVETTYGQDAPAWLVAGKFYQRRNHPTGTSFESASTNNVLWNIAKIAGERGIYFDESFGRKGGSDSDYFSRAHALGATISWAADAVVYETLERERYALPYLLKRKFRTRNSEAFFKGLKPARRISIAMRSSWKMLSGVVFLPFSVLFGVHTSVKALCRVVEGTGRLFGALGVHIGWDEYHGN